MMATVLSRRMHAVPNAAIRELKNHHGTVFYFADYGNNVRAVYWHVHLALAWSTQERVNQNLSAEKPRPYKEADNILKSVDSNRQPRRSRASMPKSWQSRCQPSRVYAWRLAEPYSSRHSLLLLASEDITMKRFKCRLSNINRAMENHSFGRRGKQTSS